VLLVQLRDGAVDDRAVFNTADIERGSEVGCTLTNGCDDALVVGLDFEDFDADDLADGEVVSRLDGAVAVESLAALLRRGDCATYFISR